MGGGVYFFVKNVLYEVLSCLKYDKIKFGFHISYNILISRLITKLNSSDNLQCRRQHNNAWQFGHSWRSNIQTTNTT